MDHIGAHPTTGMALPHMGVTSHHVAPGAGRHPAANTEDIPRDLHAWQDGQGYPWCRPGGNILVAPAVEALSLTATLQRHPDKNGAPLPAQRRGPACPARMHNRCQTLGFPHFGTCPRAPWPMQPKPSKGLSHRPSCPVPESAAYRRGGLVSVEKEQTHGPILPHGSLAGFAQHRRHADRGVGGDRA